MREKFTTEVIVKLSGKIPDDELSLIRETILSSLANYEISERQTALALYESFVPKFYEMYLAILNINGRSIGTIKTYNYHLVNFFLQLDRQLYELTSSDIYRYLLMLQNKGSISNRTLDHIRLIINSFFEWCVNEGYISKNPCRTVKPIKYVTKEREPLTDIELEQVRDSCSDVREAAIVETLYSTGCRISELSQIKKSDVDFTDGSVIVLGKGNKFRKTFLNARATLMLSKYIHMRSDDCEYLFVTARRPYRQIQTTSYERMIKRLGERANLDRPLSPHILRHTFATNLLKRGASIEDVQKLLGHTNPSTTLIYTKIDTSSIRRDHERYII